MNKHIIFSLILSAVFCVNLYSQNTAPERDVQIWSDVTVSKTLYKSTDDKGKEFDRVTGFVFGTLRFGRNVSRPVDERIGGGFDIALNKYFTFSPSYLYRAGQPFRGRKEFEHRVRFDLSAEKKWSGFSIKDRNRVEYRIRNNRSDSVRYRNKIQLKVPVKQDGKEIFAPFVATEPFYDFQAKSWTRNEFSAGISKKFTSNTSGDFFYLLQNNRGNSFKYINIFGISMKFKID